MKCEEGGPPEFCEMSLTRFLLISETTIIRLEGKDFLAYSLIGWPQSRSAAALSEELSDRCSCVRIADSVAYAKPIVSSFLFARAVIFRRYTSRFSIEDSFLILSV